MERNDGSNIHGDVNVNGGDFVGRDKITVTSTPSPTEKSLREAYLNLLIETCGQLSLSGIDKKAASDAQANLNLSAVYTALLTETPKKNEPKARRGLTTIPEGRQDRRSALEMLNKTRKLVLLGDPGSGKSTFVNFVVICLAGELLNRSEANLALLRTPLPKDKPEEKADKPQQWEHGALLPVRVILRDLTARGMPEIGQPVEVNHLWQFLTAELERQGLGDYAPYLRKQLVETGGIILFDGLDEVPEADQRRAQIKTIVEGFSAALGKCRFVVTSRTYAYQKPEWKLKDFAETTLAPFTDAQIRQFIRRWYAHIALIRKMNTDDAKGRAALLERNALQNPRLRGFAERPLLLTLMASLHAWRGGALPEKREELYNDAVDLLLDWWEGQRVVRNAKGEILLAQPSLLEWLKIKDRDGIRSLINELAFQAHSRQPTLSGTADIPEGDLLSGLMRLSERENVNIRELRNFLSQRAGLLLPRGEGVFTFPHRTFQEYLAACYLTEHDYPENVAEITCTDPDRWREVALLAGAKAGRGATSTVWLLADFLCYEDPPGTGISSAKSLWGAQVAGQLLVESANLQNVSDRNTPKLRRVQKWLVNILEGNTLPALERCEAGDSLARLGDPRFDPDFFHLPRDEDGLAGFVEIPAGPFVMGEGEQEHQPVLPTFWLARFPVTAAQFGVFAASGGYGEKDFWVEAKQAGYWSEAGFKGDFDAAPRQGPRQYDDARFALANHPVVGVSWYEALAYCRWLEQTLRQHLAAPAPLRALLESGFCLALPSEAEWEKAARGGGRSQYPWEGKFDPNKANTAETGIGATSAVGCFPEGAARRGPQDMSGNVWEWTRSVYMPYPFEPEDRRREDLSAKGDRVLRGGSWSSSATYARCAARSRYNPDNWLSDFGFRVSLSRRR